MIFITFMIGHVSLEISVGTSLMDKDFSTIFWNEITIRNRVQNFLHPYCGCINEYRYLYSFTETGLPSLETDNYLG